LDYESRWGQFLLQAVENALGRFLFLRGHHDDGVTLTTHLKLLPEVKNKWGYLSFSPYVFMEWYELS
jgi:hypothetical protein